MNLIFFKQPGCQYCKSMLPHVRKFAKAHPEIPLQEVDITEISDWPEGRWTPKSVPTLLLLREGQRSRTITGLMTHDQIARWIERVA